MKKNYQTLGMKRLDVSPDGCFLTGSIVTESELSVKSMENGFSNAVIGSDAGFVDVPFGD